ncbi:site-specific integrase [Kribbella sp. NPDC026596]|uniref:site-specific integrase n=1 Tax=Kribbella sp. NPDC026596 TaxID=3155122 RepID=UPI0033DB13D3
MCGIDLGLLVWTHLSDFIACGNRPGRVRGYAYDLLRWWRWLHVVKVVWSHARVDEVRDYVLWLQRATKSRSTARTHSAATAGTVNPMTGKQPRRSQDEAKGGSTACPGRSSLDSRISGCQSSGTPESRASSGATTRLAKAKSSSAG